MIKEKLGDKQIEVKNRVHSTYNKLKRALQRLGCVVKEYDYNRFNDIHFMVLDKNEKDIDLYDTPKIRGEVYCHKTRNYFYEMDSSLSVTIKFTPCKDSFLNNGPDVRKTSRDNSFDIPVISKSIHEALVHKIKCKKQYEDQQRKIRKMSKKSNDISDKYNLKEYEGLRVGNTTWPKLGYELSLHLRVDSEKELVTLINKVIKSGLVKKKAKTENETN